MKKNSQGIIMFLLVLATIGYLILWGCSQDDAQKIEWMSSVDEALVLAGNSHKPVMIDFMATWCPPCQKMEDSTFSHAGVIAKTREFITVRVDVDQDSVTANQWNGNAGKYGGIGIPNILFLDPHGHEITHPVGFKGPGELLAIMDSVLTVGHAQ